MGPQRKEQETSIQQNSSQEAHPVSSGRSHGSPVFLVVPSL